MLCCVLVVVFLLSVVRCCLFGVVVRYALLVVGSWLLCVVCLALAMFVVCCLLFALFAGWGVMCTSCLLLVV